MSSRFRFLSILLLSVLIPFPAVFAYNFSISTLPATLTAGATSLQFGPDQRLYVALENGQIKAFTIERTAPNSYRVIATEDINLITSIPNYDDSGARNFTLSSRQVTGLLVVGTAAAPILYVTSSDPRIGGGAGGENDLNLDTNSGIISRLTRSGATWTKVDLVRGLPRSEENHASNGMQLEPITNILYLAQGGNTNAGGPSINFAYACETALSGAILSIDLNALNALPLKTDAYGQKYLYNLPTLDDPNPARTRNTDGSNANDPFGGNDGLNQAKLVPGGPVQIYSPGFRNVYDLVLTRAPGREGRLYTFDNGANQGWGGYPKNEGPGGTVTNEYVEGEPGAVNNLDNFHFISARGYYGGHPNPLRANPAGAGWSHFDNSLPSGAQKIFSASPTTDWPAVPVSLANSVEGDYRSPGVANGALLTNNSSTNGLAEYVATNFSGEMQGNIIAASYDGRLLRIALTQNGTAVTNGVETLAAGFGTLPLDVTTPDPANGTAFVGTIWVAHYSPAKISILEPADFDSPGSSTCTGINSFDVDEDGDGYSNADEIANDSNPCSGAIRPPDVDADFVSDLLDQDDDNDGIVDTQDPFPLDAQNGKSVPMPVRYDLFNDAGSGFFSVGLTGVMMNRGEDYLQRMSADNVIAGGTAGLFTIAQAGSGLALGNGDNQKDAYQFAINSDEFTSPYIITSRLAGPFFANNPVSSQRHGIYLGNGDQDNFIWVALHANGGAGALEVVYEQNGAVVSQQLYPFPNLTSYPTVDLSFAVDPAAGTVQPRYLLPGGTSAVELGAPINATGQVLQSLMGSAPLAVGLFASNSGTGPVFSATWDYFEVTSLPTTAIAKVTIDPSGSDMATSSTYNSQSFVVQNLSTGGQHIQAVTIDLSSAIFPDMVYDPTGTAGDLVAKAFQADSATAGVALAAGVNTHPHNGANGQDGYDVIDLTFNSFPPNGSFGFSIDCDPTNVKGVAAPGQGDSASVSGLELIGSTVTVYFNDGSVLRTRVGRVDASVDGAFGWLRSDQPPKPGVSLLGEISPLKSGQAEHTVRVTGPAGFTASVATVEGALYLGGVPNGGYDLDPFEANTAIKVTEISGMIPAAGFKDFVVSPTRTNADAGFNYITAILSNTSSIRGPVSNKLTVWYDPSFSGADTEPPSKPGNVAATDISSRSVTLSWTASTDNNGVRGYEVLRDGTLVSSTLGLSFTDVALEAGTLYNYSIVARDEAGNVSQPATLAVSTPANGTVVLRINAGGPSFVDTKGHTWAADNGFNTGTTTTTASAIDRAVDDTLFKTDRVDSSATAPDLAYTFSVANGQYEVQLYFAELVTTNAAVGKRVFDVVIESQLAFDNLDVFAMAGAPFTAVVMTATTAVTDGQLNIAFPRGVSNPKVNAIKVVKLAAAETQPPTTPTNLQASQITSNSVTLTWGASTDNVGVTGYIVTRNGSPVATTPNLTATDTGLAGATAYDYSVVATDAAGNLSGAAVLTVTTAATPIDTVPPSAPGILTFSNVTPTAITVNWTAATDNVGVTGYRVSRGSQVLGTVSTLNYADSGLMPGTSYTYSVVALDAAGNVSTAKSGSISTSPTGGTPALVRINAGGPAYIDSFGNTWAADTGFNTGNATTASATVTGTTEPELFRTERYDPPTAPALTYTFPVPNGSYRVRLHMAETYSATKGPGLRVFSINLQGVLRFENVDIFVQAGGADTALVLEAPVTVSNGQVTIGFINQVQNPKINAIEILAATTTDTQPPTTPGNLTTSNVTATGLTLSWNAATDNTGVTGYRILRGGALITTVTGTSFTDTGLSPATGYTYSVVAFDAANNASSPASVTVTTPASADTQPPTAPGGLTFSAVTSSSITVNWTAATDNVAVTGYRISRGATVLATVPGLSYTDSGLNPATSYTFSVVALDAAGNASTATSGTVATTSGVGTLSTVRINAGGADYVDAAGRTWAADTGFNTGNTYTSTGIVSGTPDPELYRIERWDPPTAPTLTYTLPVTNGSYLVRLHFAETYTGTKGAGLRVFSVNLQGVLTFPNVDIFVQAGGADKALVLEAPVAVSNGQVLIEFINQVENPKINAIEVVPASTTDTQPPTAPTGLAASQVTSGSLTLSWTAASDNTGVTGYRVSRGGALLNTVTATSFNDSGLAPNTTYSYSIVAVDAANNVSSPATSSVKTLAAADTQPPSPPTNLASSNVTTGGATLSWTASTDNTGVTGYRISRGGTLLNTITTTSFTDSGLTPNTTYSYSVVAVDAANNLSSPATLSVQTLAPPDTQAPTAPTGLAASNLTTTGVTLTWSASTDNIGVAGYRISRGGTLLNTVTTTSFTDTGLTPGTTYSYSVVAVDAANNLSSAATLSVQTLSVPDTQAPTAPTGLAASNLTTTGVTLAWTASTDNIGVTGYRISRGGTLLNTVTTTSFTDSGLTPNTTYSYSVVAVDAANNLSTAATLSVKTLTPADTQPPTAPTGLTSANVTSTSLILSWTASSDNTGVTGYRVSRGGTLLATVSTTSYTNSGLTAATTYNYSVVAIDAANNASPAATHTVTTLPAPDTQPPTAPGTLTFNAVTSTSVTVNWTAATDNVGVTGYRISRGSTVLATVSTLNYTNTGLAPGTSYTYSVVALDAAGNISTARSGTIATTSSGGNATAVRVNAGGPTYVDNAGNTWTADTGFNTGKTTTYTTTVTGTLNPTLFRTERSDKPGGTGLSYSLPVTNGSYRVRLLLAETDPTRQAVGQRVFSVNVQGARTFQNVDIFAQAGGGNKALVLDAPITVSNGRVTLDFINQVRHAKINAIEILPVP